MYKTHHRIHIPVMGTGFTIDTALRVARFGIASVASLVDDMLIERVRKHYCRERGLAFEPIPHSHPDARAARRAVPRPGGTALSPEALTPSRPPCSGPGALLR